LSRFLRRHATALIAIAVCNFVVFFPVVFIGRVVSPNDVYFNYSPWSSLRPDTTHPQNLLINDPPTSYYTMLAMVKRDWRVFHWNPFIACGIPGFGSSAAGSVTPLILLPVLLVPLTWSYTAILFVKLNLAFFFAYSWLREERLGRRGAAVGAIIVAAAGVYSVRWLWQLTNATVFYPALLWIVCRTFHGKRTSIALVALIAFSFGVSAFPAAIAYGAWIVALYSLFLAIRSPRSAIRHLPSILAGVLIAFLIALPTLIPFARLLKRSGYLEARRNTSVEAIFPPTLWPSFIDADRLGNPALKNWRGDPQLGALNNYVESTVYLGTVALLLALVGMFNVHARARWFWIVAALLILMCMFGFPGVSTFIARLPGFKYSALARTALLLPLPAGYLAAAGAQWCGAGLRRALRGRGSGIRFIVSFALAAWLAFDLGVVAGRFHPYLDVNDAAVPTTPVIEFLRHERGPFRVAPFFDYLWPNSAELFGFEDVRSHFGSEGDYRRMLKRLDKDVWDGRSTVLQLNSLQYNFGDPLAGMLGIRYYLEHKYIDIVKWGIFAATQPGVTNLGPMDLAPNEVMERTVRIDPQPFWAIEIPASISKGTGVEITMLKDGAMLWSRRFTSSDVNAMNKLYVPVHGYAQPGDTVTIRVRSIAARASLSRGENGFYFGRVTTPVIFERELPDGRVFRNLAELPRFWAVSKFRKLNREEFLGARDVDFASEAVITDDPVMPPASATQDARVTLAHYAPDEQRVITDAAAPMFLASSEKINPDLRVTIDGKRIRPIEINMLFTGLAVPAGRHEIVFSRRIARGWWWTAIVGLILWIAAAAWDVTSSLRRRRTDTRTVPATAA
jgi:hypothetical protein